MYHYKRHSSLGKQILRALLGIFLSISFGLFWISIICQEHSHIGLLILGILSIILGIVHLVLVILKQIEYNEYRY